jgi:hypothetical protein
MPLMFGASFLLPAEEMRRIQKVKKSLRRYDSL